MKKILLLALIFTSVNLWAEDRPPHILRTEELLHNRWNQMKTELLRGNIDKALEFFIPSSREKYRQAFSALQGQLSTIFSRPEKIRLIRISDSRAICDYVVTEEDGEKYSSPMEFVMMDGEWKIAGF